MAAAARTPQARTQPPVSEAETPLFIAGVAKPGQDAGANAVGEYHASLEAAFTSEPQIRRFPPLIRAGIMVGGSGLLWAGIVALAAPLFGR